MARRRRHVSLVAEFCCDYALHICLTLVVLLGASLLFSIFPIPISFEVKRLYIPALDKSLNSSTDTSIVFDISLESSLKLPLHFDSSNVTFYDGPRLNHSVANFTLPEFRLEEAGRVDFKGKVNETNLDIDGAKQEISANGFKVFRVGITTAVHPEYDFWNFSWRIFRKTIDVKIGDTGAAPEFGSNFVAMGVLVLFNFLVIF